MSWLVASDCRSIGGSASVLPMNIQGWFPLGLIGLIPLLSKGLSGVFSSTSWSQNINSSALSLLYGTLTSVHDYWKTIALTIWTSVGKIMSLLFNTLSRFVVVWVLAFISFQCIHKYNYVGFCLFESTVCFSQRLYYSTFPPCKIWGFWFLHILINTCYFSFLNYSYPLGCEVCCRFLKTCSLSN